MKPSTLLFPYLVGLIMSSCCQRVESQGNRLSLDEPSEYKSIVTGGLQLGGSNRFGRSIEVNNYYMSFDGKPVILETPNDLDGYKKEIALLRSLAK